MRLRIGSISKKRFFLSCFLERKLVAPKCEESMNSRRRLFPVRYRPDDQGLAAFAIAGGENVTDGGLFIFVDGDNVILVDSDSEIMKKCGLFAARKNPWQGTRCRPTRIFPFRRSHSICRLPNEPRRFLDR